MADQIDLHTPGHRVIPVRPGADRDLRLQQAARLGMRPTPRQHLRPLQRQPPVDGGRADPAQQRRLLIGERDVPVAAQQRHQHRQHRCQQSPRRRPQRRPAGDQRRHQLRPIRRCPRRTRLRRSDRAARVPQHRPRPVTMPPGQLDDLIQNPRLASLIARPIRRGQLPRHRLALRHRQHPTRRTPSRRFLHEATTTLTRRFLMSQRDAWAPAMVSAILSGGATRLGDRTHHTGSHKRVARRWHE